MTTTASYYCVVKIEIVDGKKKAAYLQTNDCPLDIDLFENAFLDQFPFAYVYECMVTLVRDHRFYGSVYVDVVISNIKPLTLL